MAVPGSLLTANSNATPAATYNTASISWGAGELLIAEVWGLDDAFTTPPTFSLSTAGLTWVSVIRVPSAAGAPGASQVFRAMSASPGSGVITIDADVATLNMAQWIISKRTGVDTGGTNGSAAIGNVASNTTTSASTLSVTLPAFGSANNGTHGSFSAGNDMPLTFNFTPGSGFTELAETVIAAVGGAFYFGLQSQFRTDTDTSVDVSTTVSQGEIIGIALEIVAASASTTRGMPFGTRGTAFNGGRTLTGILKRSLWLPRPHSRFA